MITPRAATRASVLAAMVIAGAASLLMGARSAPWGFIDETVHTGYLVELSRGNLPTLDTKLPDLDDDDYRFRRDLLPPNSRGEHTRQQVWVANHPPGAYLVAVPPTWLTMRSGDQTMVLAWQRGASAFGVAMVVGFTALLARALTGDRRAVVVAAGLTAASPFLIGMGARGLTDASSLAAAVAGVWGGTMIARRGLTRPTVVLAAVVLAGAGLARISALAAALAAIGMGVAVDAVRRRRITWRAALIPVPAAVLTGWFYVRNTVLYGDPAASAEILHRYDRQPVGWSFAASRWTIGDGSFSDGWLNILNIALTGTTDGPYLPSLNERYVASLGGKVIVACIGAAVVVVVARRLRAGDDPTARLAVWLPAMAALVATFLGAVNHVAGGGLPHPRYLLLVVPVAACVSGRATSLVLRTTAGAAGLLGLVPVVALGLYTSTRDWASALPKADGVFLQQHRLGPDSLDVVLLTVLGLAACVYLVSAGATWSRRGEEVVVEARRGGAAASHPVPV